MGNTRRALSPVGRRLREARETRGLSQKRLGILAGMDQFSASARVNQYERDTHVPDFATAKRLARVLEVPVTFLYAEDDEMAEVILSYAKASRATRSRIGALLKDK